jgi:hypothetical protein
MNYLEMETDRITDNNPPEIHEDDRSELIKELSGLWNKFYSSPANRKVLHTVLVTGVTALVFVFIFLWFFLIVPALQESGRKTLRTESLAEVQKDPAYKKLIGQMTKDYQRLSRKFASYTSGQSYLIINTIDNKFVLYQNKKIVREGSCSTGSYTRLTSAEGSRHWIFKTPKGRFLIQQKITSPLWVRPDWSFVEEGLPIPPPNDESRFEYGVLGDYAMSLGDGYLIHGTIYKRLLGMPVTHGCVRLNDADLEAIYNTMNIGSKVYIF